MKRLEEINLATTNKQKINRRRARTSIKSQKSQKEKSKKN
jgi:hypothetical protein